MSIIETIRARRSCRTYSDRPIETDRLAELKASLEANTAAPFGSAIRFHLLDLNELGTDEIGPLGTYGVIRGARLFIIGAVGKGPKAMEDYGYCMEKNVLAATALGLGTCWLGGTFRRSGFARMVNLNDGELLPAISPAG
jgi:nitroreductase